MMLSGLPFASLRKTGQRSAGSVRCAERRKTSGRPAMTFSSMRSGIFWTGLRARPETRFARVFGFAAFGGGGGKLQFAFLELDADGAGALVGELGHAGDGGAEVFAIYGDALAVVLGQDSFVVGELSGELARGQQARADAGGERGFIFGKVDCLGACAVTQRC